MNLFDVVLVLVAVAVAVGGYRLGFVTRVASWIGMLGGLALAVWLLPWLLDQLGPSDDLLVLAVSVGTVFAASFLGQAVGIAVGTRLRPVDEDDGGVTRIDGIAGAVAGLAGLVVVVWLLLPLLSETGGWVGQQVRSSTLAQRVDGALPEPPDALQAMRAFVGDDRFPQVFEDLAPTPDLGPPPAASGLDAATAASTARSVVLVEGEACDRIQDGTGWVVADELVVTNAHVVAGERATQVERDDGRHLDAELVVFDPATDLALLAVPGLARPALPLGSADGGETGAVFGHPGGGALRLAPAEVAREIQATGRDIYGRPGVERSVLELSAGLAPGDSGAPLVTPDGRVAGVVFAIAVDRPDVAYALTSSEVDELLERPRSTETSAGACIG